MIDPTQFVSEEEMEEIHEHVDHMKNVPIKGKIWALLFVFGMMLHGLIYFWLGNYIVMSFWASMAISWGPMILLSYYQLFRVKWIGKNLFYYRYTEKVDPKLNYKVNERSESIMGKITLAWWLPVWNWAMFGWAIPLVVILLNWIPRSETHWRNVDRIETVPEINTWYVQLDFGWSTKMVFDYNGTIDDYTISGDWHFPKKVTVQMYDGLLGFPVINIPH